MDPGQGLVEQADPRHPGEGALEADVGQPAEPDRAVDDDRVAACAAGAQPLRIVVGELVDHDEGPHLHREEDDVATPSCAAAGRRPPSGPGGAGGDRHRGGNPRPLAEQGNGEGGRHDAGRAGPQGHP